MGASACAAEPTINAAPVDDAGHAITSNGELVHNFDPTFAPDGRIVFVVYAWQRHERELVRLPGAAADAGRPVQVEREHLRSSRPRQRQGGDPANDVPLESGAQPVVHVATADRS